MLDDGDRDAQKVGQHAKPILAAVWRGRFELPGPRPFTFPLTVSNHEHLATRSAVVLRSRSARFLISTVYALYQESETTLLRRTWYCVDRTLNVLSLIQLLVQSAQDNSHHNGHDDCQSCCSAIDG